MIRSVLIANRGEIACRIVRSCRALGIRTVAVFSDADEGAKHVRLADTAVRLGPAPASESYLNQTAILDIASQTGVDAVHPGYGFLAENAAFARACLAANIIFIGPNPLAIEGMGNKQAAKAMAAEAGVPVLPGYGGEDQSDGRFQIEAEKMGPPFLVKAAAGGGGKGMRLVTNLANLPASLAAARREAQQAFGSDELLLERALRPAHHVEIQVFGDRQGNIIHLGERDCSIQRRHQKVVEESPSPKLTPTLRARMGETAVSVAQALSYDNAGTVEFLLDSQGNFYFLEMNTRLQVEHAVTEMITGVDLVAWQIRVAAGEPLPLRQSEVTFSGHALEARLYAEDPAKAFFPVTGRVLLWRAPAGEGVRIDDGIQTGDEVSVHYDPLLAKVIAYGPDRQTAVQRLTRALQSAVLLGFTNNLAYLQAIVQQPDFAAGTYSTEFLADRLADWQPSGENVALGLTGAALAQFYNFPQHPQNSGYWRNNPNEPIRIEFLEKEEGEKSHAVLLEPVRFKKHTFNLTVAKVQRTIMCAPQTGPEWTLAVDGRVYRLLIVPEKDQYWVWVEGEQFRLLALPRLSRPTAVSASGSSLRAPMPGSVVAVLVSVGQKVAKGTPLLKLEAMKMEHTIQAPHDGHVAEIFFSEGDTVPAEARLLRMEFAH